MALKGREVNHLVSEVSDFWFIKKLITQLN